MLQSSSAFTVAFKVINGNGGGSVIEKLSDMVLHYQTNVPWIIIIKIIIKVITKILAFSFFMQCD